MCPAVVRVCVGLVVLTIGLGGVGQWKAMAGGAMYWTDLGISKIQRVNLDGTGLRDLVATKPIRVVPRKAAASVMGLLWQQCDDRRHRIDTIQRRPVVPLAEDYPNRSNSAQG